MNAWYIHYKFNFNFFPYIYPLFISMFFKNFPYEEGITYGVDYLNDNVISEFRKYSPVGTRDIHTKKIFDNLDVDNYFSGCLTLTIEKFSNIKKEDYIVVVGLKNDEINYIKSKTDREIKIIKQDVPYGSFSNEPWKIRKKRVIEILKIYQGAHMVITTKLHCSLPCLALETPVLLLYDKSFPENEDRIGTYLDYLNYVNRSDFIKSNIDFSKPKNNSKKYLELRNGIIDKCSCFINNSKKVILDRLPDIDSYKKCLKMSVNSRKNIIKHLKDLSKKYVEECRKSAEMCDEINELKYQNNGLNNEINSLKKENKILNNNNIELKNKNNDLNKQYNDLNKQYNDLNKQYNDLNG